MIYRNAAEAFSSKLAEIVYTGREVRVRGSLTKELNQQTIVLTDPLERCIAVPHRNNNLFAAIAESVWVIAGRNDLAFLTPYLPRATDFSDDGLTWRAGYGPRLRDWRGTDQIAAVKHLLGSAPESRRAVMSIYDPALDFGPSKDIPCTNWLHFTVRDGALDLNVAVRSNDIVWGFSGINTFEWSVLQEMMAFWLGTKVGQTAYFISSLHLYEHHFDRANRILSAPAVRTPYDHSPAAQRFSTPFADLPAVLEHWFRLEQCLRSGAVLQQEIDAFPDPLLRDFLYMLDAYWSVQRDPGSDVTRLLANVQDLALVRAAESHFKLIPPEPAVAGAPNRAVSGTPSRDELIRYLSNLHRVKDAMYGSSWKRRGEQISIMANVARKVDRLVLFDPKAPSARETVFDTAADLLVYSLKYECYLSDVLNVPRQHGQQPWSEGTAGFEYQLAKLPRSQAKDSSTEAISLAAKAFEALEGSFDDGSTPHERVGLVRGLSAASWVLFVTLARDNPVAAYGTLAAGENCLFP